MVFLNVIFLKCSNAESNEYQCYIAGLHICFYGGAEIRMHHICSTKPPLQLSWVTVSTSLSTKMATADTSYSRKTSRQMILLSYHWIVSWYMYDIDPNKSVKSIYTKRQHAWIHTFNFGGTHLSYFTAIVIGRLINENNSSDTQKSTFASKYPSGLVSDVSPPLMCSRWREGNAVVSYRPSFLSFYRHTLLYQTWCIHLMGCTTRRVRVSLESVHFDLLYNQK